MPPSMEYDAHAAAGGVDPGHAPATTTAIGAATTGATSCKTRRFFGDSARGVDADGVDADGGTERSECRVMGGLWPRTSSHGDG